MEILIMILLFTGMIPIWIGWAAYPKNWHLISAGGLICVGFACVVSYDASTALGYMLIIPGYIWLIYQIVQGFQSGKIKHEAKLLEIGGTKLDRFFVECVLSECNDFTLPKNVARAKLLADKYKLSYPNGVEELYREGLRAHEAVSGKVKSDALEALKQKEREEYSRLNRYANHHGKEKRIAMLRDRMNELRKAAKASDEAASMVLRSVTEQERNWGIWGGIADGLAGPVAGVSMALDVQADNARIRAQNEANCRAAMPVIMNITGNASQNRRNADAIEKEISLMQEKLMGDASGNDVLGMLNITNPVVEVSESGAYRVSATVEPKKRLYIYGDVPAVADGTIIAHVFEEGREIGTANLVLPVNGTEMKTGILGIGLSGADPTKSHKVTFTASNLWLQER